MKFVLGKLYIKGMELEEFKKIYKIEDEHSPIISEEEFEKIEQLSVDADKEEELDEAIDKLDKQAHLKSKKKKDSNNKK